MERNTTLFALQSLTSKNANECAFDKTLATKGYYSQKFEDNLPEEIRPAQYESTILDANLPLIPKGVALARNLADQIVDFEFNINKIYCSKEERSRQTAIVVAKKIYERTGKKCNIIVDDLGRLDARGRSVAPKMNLPKLVCFESEAHYAQRVYNFFNLVNSGKEIKSYHWKSDAQAIFQGIETENELSLHRKPYDLKNALIIGDCEMWNILKNNPQVKFVYYGKKSGMALKRGQVALIEIPKELKVENLLVAENSKNCILI